MDELDGGRSPARFSRKTTKDGNECDEITRFACLCKVIAFWTELYRVSVHANLPMAERG